MTRRDVFKLLTGAPVLALAAPAIAEEVTASAAGEPQCLSLIGEVVPDCVQGETVEVYCKQYKWNHVDVIGAIDTVNFRCFSVIDVMVHGDAFRTYRPGPCISLDLELDPEEVQRIFDKL